MQMAAQAGENACAHVGIECRERGGNLPRRALFAECAQFDGVGYFQPAQEAYYKPGVAAPYFFLQMGHRTA